MKYRHIILEGKPTTGKTEVSELFKIYFPGRVRVLPELTTVLVRSHGLNILRDRQELTDLLREAVPARAREVRTLRAAADDALVFEESHMGVHWAYSTILDDRTFLDVYDTEIRPHILEPDLYVRLDIPIGLSVQRQKARATKDVEVDDGIIRQMFTHLLAWHTSHEHDNVAVVDTNRSPELVIADLLGLLELEYDVFSG